MNLVDYLYIKESDVAVLYKNIELVDFHAITGICVDAKDLHNLKKQGVKILKTHHYNCAIRPLWTLSVPSCPEVPPFPFFLPKNILVVRYR